MYIGLFVDREFFTCRESFYIETLLYRESLNTDFLYSGPFIQRVCMFIESPYVYSESYI